MDLGTILLALGSAIIGASGAVASQFVSARLTAKREKQKADADRSRWEADSEARRRDRNLDQKMALFAELLTNADALNMEAFFGIVSDKEKFPELWSRAKRIREQAETISLLAQEVYEHASLLAESCVSLVRTRNLESQGADTGAASSKTGEAIRIARNAFQEYLGHKPVIPPEVAGK